MDQRVLPVLPVRLPLAAVLLPLVALLAGALPAGARAPLPGSQPGATHGSARPSVPAGRFAPPASPAEQAAPPASPAERETVHVWASPDLEPGTEARLAELAGRARRFLAGRLGLDLAGPVTVAVYGMPASYEQAAVALGVAGRVARGLAEGSAGLTTADGRTILLNAAVARRAGSLAAAVAHELTHSLLRTNGVTGAARWLEEGLAHWLQNEFCAETACRPHAGPLQRGSPFRPELPSLARVRAAARQGLLGPLAADTGLPSSEAPGGAAYGPQEYAAAAFLALRARYGDAPVLRYLHLLRDLPHDLAFAASFGLSPGEWEEWLRASLRAPAPPPRLRLCLALERAAVVTLTAAPAAPPRGPAPADQPRTLTLPKGSHCLMAAGGRAAGWLTVSLRPVDGPAASPFGAAHSLDLIFRAEPGLAYFAGSILRLDDGAPSGGTGGETVYSLHLQSLEGVALAAAEALPAAADTDPFGDPAVATDPIGDPAAPAGEPGLAEADGGAGATTVKP